MDKLEKDLLNLVQNDFPLSVRPFEEIGTKLGISEERCIEMLQNLSDTGILRSVRAVINWNSIGYSTMLIGMKVQPNNIAEVAEFNRFTDFENEKLSAVSDYIMTNYGYKMTIPEEYDNQRITVRINKKEDLKTIVQLISEMYNLKFEINEELKQITFR